MAAYSDDLKLSITIPQIKAVPPDKLKSQFSKDYTLSLLYNLISLLVMFSFNEHKKRKHRTMFPGAVRESILHH